MTTTERVLTLTAGDEFTVRRGGKKRRLRYVATRHEAGGLVVTGADDRGLVRSYMADAIEVVHRTSKLESHGQAPAPRRGR